MNDTFVIILAAIGTLTGLYGAVLSTIIWLSERKNLEVKAFWGFKTKQNDYGESVPGETVLIVTIANKGKKGIYLNGPPWIEHELGKNYYFKKILPDEKFPLLTEAGNKKTFFIEKNVITKDLESFFLPTKKEDIEFNVSVQDATGLRVKTQEKLKLYPASELLFLQD